MDCQYCGYDTNDDYAKMTMHHQWWSLWWWSIFWFNLRFSSANENRRIKVWFECALHIQCTIDQIRVHHLNSHENLKHSSQHLNLGTAEMESEILSSLLIHTLSTFSFKAPYTLNLTHRLLICATKTRPLRRMMIRWLCIMVDVNLSKREETERESGFLMLQSHTWRSS